MRKPRQYTVICLDNEGYEVSLERHKVYAAIDDQDAEKHGLVRVVDESGEDYLYPSKSFTQIDLPPNVHRAVLRAA